MDKQKAVEQFAVQLEKMTRLPLVTDSEMVALYGDEVMAAVAELDCFGSATGICGRCATRCCMTVKCEFYLPELGQCPIFEFRPSICRLHYCHRFFPKDDTYLKDLSDVFFDGLLLSQSLGSKKVKLFDSPPMVRCTPELVQAIIPIITAVKESRMQTAQALSLIRIEADKFRTPTL
jgi:hypothetical protein